MSSSYLKSWVNKTNPMEGLLIPLKPINTLATPLSTLEESESKESVDAFLSTLLPVVCLIVPNYTFADIKLFFF